MKKHSHKGLTLLILALVLCAFALASACNALIGERYQTTLDLTEARLYELSAQTEEIVSSLSAPTTLYVFYSESEYPSMFKEMLRRYAQLSVHISVSYVDPAENPVLVSHFNQRGVTPSSGDILVEGGKRLKLVAYADLVIADSSQQVTGVDLEQQVTAAIAYANSEYAPSVVFTTGHNERPSSSLQKLFTDNGFTLSTLSLAQQDPGTPEVIVIAAPTADFTQQDMTVLRSCLAGGSRLMVFLESSETAMPNLTALLGEYGIIPDNNVLFEPQAYASGAAHNIIPMYASHEINAYFAENPTYVVAPSSGSLRLDSRAEALLTTTPAAYAKTNLRYTSSEKEAQDATGQSIVAAISNGQVFVCGSRMVYADDLMTSSSYANRMFLAQVLSALWEEGVSVSIPAKTLSSALLPISAGQAQLLSILLTAVLPAAALLAGTVAIIRRRKAQ